MKNQDIELPKPVLKSDLTSKGWYENSAMEDFDNAKYTQYGGPISFELWYTNRFGWCIPTLGIRGISSRGRSAGVTTARTYGISIKDKTPVTMGHGPHVLATHTVYVRKNRLEALTPLLDLMIQGQAKAGEIRDRISTRRANTTLRRRGYDSFVNSLGF